MKIYCTCCDKVQPVIIDNCLDAKTEKPFQDIVCEKCHLVIASGTDIRCEWVGLTDGEIEASKPPLSNDAVVWELAVEWAEAKLKEKNT